MWKQLQAIKINVCSNNYHRGRLGPQQGWGGGGVVNGQITKKEYIENEDSYIRNHLFKKDVSYVDTSSAICDKTMI